MEGAGDGAAWCVSRYIYIYIIYKSLVLKNIGYFSHTSCIVSVWAAAIRLYTKIAPANTDLAGCFQQMLDQTEVQSATRALQAKQTVQRAISLGMGIRGGQELLFSVRVHCFGGLMEYGALTTQNTPARSANDQNSIGGPPLYGCGSKPEYVG